ncbi:hypothetical protein JMJ35_003558 [Cladonia borealis]|uniref:Uncharacterized protein n=1 Tax=Cladonia borealis TaxID=184061 RepID=A0AA39UBW4_9LECA|nr:hypothetical protein JMJ35_003558 [Cladonia borealis]
MKSSSYLPFLLTLTTANAAALLPRSPQLGDSNPGEFIDPTLSHSNPSNNKSLSSGPYVASPVSTILSTPPITYYAVPSDEAAASSLSPAAASSAVAELNAMMAAATSLSPADASSDVELSAMMAAASTYSLSPAASSSAAAELNAMMAAATSTYSISPAAASSAAAELNAMMDEMMNSTYLDNETYPYYDGYYNGGYNGSYHDHHHNSSWWNSTDFLNITENYNTTNNLVEIVTVEPNGTVMTQYYNVTEGYGYGYGNYNGSWGGHHHNHTGQYNGTNWWTELMANETDTDMAATDTATAVAPLSTGTGLASTYDLTNKPGFTGPKSAKRGSKLYGRWLSGVL